MDCVPPWLTNKKQCLNNITTYRDKSNITTMILDNFIYPKYERTLTAAQTKCNDPCLRMTSKISLMSENDGYHNSYLKFRFKKTVRVEKKVVVYTWFNFIVDVGSSLGLWLGLSALGITNLVIEVFLLAKNCMK